PIRVGFELPHPLCRHGQSRRRVLTSILCSLGKIGRQSDQNAPQAIRRCLKAISAFARRTSACFNEEQWKAHWAIRRRDVVATISARCLRSQNGSTIISPPITVLLNRFYRATGTSNWPTRYLEYTQGWMTRRGKQYGPSINLAPINA